MDQDKIDRLRVIRNLSALGLLENLDYSECLDQISAVAQGKQDGIKAAKAPEPERKRRGTRDRKETGGQDRAEE